MARVQCLPCAAFGGAAGAHPRAALASSSTGSQPDPRGVPDLENAMSIAIQTTSMNGTGTTRDPQAAERRQARNALGEALGGGSLDQAREAFASFAGQNSSQRVVAHPNGPFAQLQAALQAGDLQAAQRAYLQLPGVRKGQQPEDAQTLGGKTDVPRQTTPSPDATVGRLLDVSA